MLALPTEEKSPVFEIQLPKSCPDYGEPMVPQIEEVPPQEVPFPEPLDHYLVAQPKTEKAVPRRQMNVVRRQPNFLQKLVEAFIKLQKREAAK